MASFGRVASHGNLGRRSDTLEKIFPAEPAGKPPFQQNTTEHGPGGPVGHASLGQLFSVTAAGNVTGVRFFANAKETLPHTAHIWRSSDGKQLARTAIPASVFGTAHWVDFPIGPVALDVGVEYMVSTGHGCGAVCHWAGGVG